MEEDISISFRDVPPSEAVKSAIRSEAAGLEKFYDRTVGCHVVVAEPHRHQHQGRLYLVQVRLIVPGEELVVSHEHPIHPGHGDVYQAVREAFHAVRRELEDYVRRVRHQVKRHEERPHGRVARVVPWDDYGFIKTADGRELYFHRNSLLDGGFERLRPGDEVSFAEGQGDKGSSAKSVRLVRSRPGEDDHPMAREGGAL